MKEKVITLGATFAMVMSMGSSAIAAQPEVPGNSVNAQTHAGHWGYVQSGTTANGIPAAVFHAGLDENGIPGYAPGVGGWAEYVEQGGPGPFK